MKKISKQLIVLLLMFVLINLNVAPVFGDDTVSTPSGSDSASAPAVAVDPAPSSTPEFSPLPADSSVSTSTDAVVASTTNDATTTNTVGVQALTGDNTASTTGTTTIITGDVTANAAITNILNVNVFNSNALIEFLNRLSQGDGSVDLRNLNSALTCTDCAVSSTTLETTPVPLTSSTTNTAFINNAVIVRSLTGNNNASSTDGATIQTGDAYAAANIVNVANANFIDSHYVMLILNNYGTLKGDIVLPNTSFFDYFLNTTTSNSTVPIISSNTTNTAQIENNASTTAETGNNQATSTGQSLIATGNAQAGSTVVNTVNQNILGGNSVAIVFRIYGNWTGTAYNVPSQFMWGNTPVGIEFLSTAPNFYSGNMSAVQSSASNTAVVSNNVSVSANTGNNHAQGSQTSIKTGNAYATANILNLVNTNVIGSNWINAVINIFGDWNGNISFGQPDLWVGTRASFKGGSGPGGSVVYDYTIKNNGDAPAHNVMLTHGFDAPYISFSKDVGSSWNIGTIEPGQTVQVQHEALITTQLPNGYLPVSNTVTVTETESDGNTKDNTDTLSLVIENPIQAFPVRNADSGNTSGAPAHFIISNTNDATSTILASSTVNYTISILNDGGNAEDAILTDKITDAAGGVYHSEQWDLGQVKSQEQILIKYTTFFSASTTEGTYINFAQIISSNGTFGTSSIATSSVRIVKPEMVTQSHQLKTLKAVQYHPIKKLTAAATTTVEAHAATSTATATLALVTAANNRTGLLANALSALGFLSGYWVLLIILLAALGIVYLTSQRRIHW